MTEEQTEVAQEQPQTEQVAVQEPNEAQNVAKNDSDRNWEEARSVIKQLKHRIDELEQRPQQSQQPQQVVEDDMTIAMNALGIDKEDVLTAEQSYALTEKVSDIKAEKKARQIVQEYAQQQNLANDEQKARAKYDDFDFVIENYAIPMIKNDPALAYKIQTSRNPAETAYKLAKISDEYEGTQMKQQTSPKAEKILKNSSRPVSSNAVGQPLKSQADDFSKLSPQQVWEMSQKFARGS